MLEKGILFFALLISNHCFAQYETLFHKPYHQKVQELADLYGSVIEEGDSTAAYRKIDEVSGLARKKEDPEMLLQMQLLRAYYNCQHELKEPDILLTELEQVGQSATQQGYINIQLRALHTQYWYCWNHLLNYERGIDYLLRMEPLLSQVSDEFFPDKAACYNSLGSAYYFFGDLQHAKTYYQKVFKIPVTEFNSAPFLSAINNLGLCYQQLKMLDSADYYFLQTIDFANTFSNEQFRGIATGNLAKNLLIKGKLDDAIPLFREDIRIATIYDDHGLIAGANINLADIYLQKGRLDSAWQAIIRARNEISLADQPQRLRLLFPLMSKWYSRNGKPELAVDYLDSTITATQKYYEDRNALQLLRSSQQMDLRNKNRELAQLERLKERKIANRNLTILIFAACGMLFLVFGYYKQRQLAQQNKLQRLEIQKSELELARSKLQLQEFSRRIAEKNEIIERLEFSQLAENKELLEGLRRSAILTEQDWTAFKNMFEKVYPTFFNRLRQKFPGLTPAETRFMALQKLDLSPAEIANSLGVSKKSLHVTWHRIRKRLALEEAESAQDLLQVIG